MRGCLPVFTACIALFLCGAVIHAVGDGPVTLELPADDFIASPVYDPETHSYDFYISRSNTATLRNGGGTDADVRLLFVPAEGLAAAAFFTVGGQTSVGGISLVLPAGQNTEVGINIACLPDSPLDREGGLFQLGIIKMSARGGQIEIEAGEKEATEDQEEPVNPEELERQVNQGDMDTSEDPKAPEEPENPDDMEVLKDPKDTESPEPAENPGEPENREDTEDSKEPENKKDTENPKEPENPKDTEDPKEPENPEDTENPGKPGNREDTEDGKATGQTPAEQAATETGAKTESPPPGNAAITEEPGEAPAPGAMPGRVIPE
jgi:hypothetical protein